MAPASVPTFGFLPVAPVLTSLKMDYKLQTEINPFLHKFLLVMVFYHSKRNPKTRGESYISLWLKG